MAKAQIEFQKTPSGEDYLLVKTRHLDTILDYINKKNIRHLTVNPYLGFQKNNLDFLSWVPAVTHLSVEGKLENIEGIYHLKSCKYLWLSDMVKHKVDFSLLKKLETLGFFWHSNIVNLHKCKSLRELNIIRYSFADHSLYQLRQLQRLTINQPHKLNDLDFLNNFKKLNELSLVYCRDLNDLTGLQKIRKTIRSLQFDHCPKVVNWSVLSKLTYLEKIILSDSAPIPSLNWIKSLKKLTQLSFVGTDVIDGNLEPCIGLDFVGFNNKKKYNRTFEELNPRWGI